MAVSIRGADTSTSCRPLTANTAPPCPGFDPRTCVHPDCVVLHTVTGTRPPGPCGEASTTAVEGGTCVSECQWGCETEDAAAKLAWVGEVW